MSHLDITYATSRLQFADYMLRFISVFGVIIVGLLGFVFIFIVSTDSATAKDIDDLLADAIP